MKTEELEQILDSNGFFYRYDNTLKSWQLVFDDMIVLLPKTVVEKSNTEQIKLLIGQQILQLLVSQEKITVH